MSYVSRGKKIDPLTKRVPENPKYKHVRSGIDTGASMSKYLERLEDIKNNYRFRKDEIFKRMKITTFVHLIVQVYQINQDEGFEYLPDSPTNRPETADASESEMAFSIPPSTAGTARGDNIPDTARSTFLSVSRGVGELDLNQPPPALPRQTEDSLPYLLLDIRDADDYDMCHIVGAVSYPKSSLSKATNYEIKHMLAYKNKQGKVIIVYDEDERMATDAAKTLVQRGYDNLFMLSGGMKVAHKVFPEGLFTGSVPPTITGQKSRQNIPATQQEFEQEDIDRLEMYLDNQLSDNSFGNSSRLSKASSRMSSTSSVASKASSRSTSSVISDRPAFR